MKMNKIDGSPTKPVAEVSRKNGVVGVQFYEGVTYGCDLTDGTKLYASPIDKDRLRATNSASAFYKEQSEKAEAEIDRLATRVAELEAEIEALANEHANESKRADRMEYHLAQLRHAYTHLKSGSVKDQGQFADGLLSPAIAALETALTPSTRGSNDDK